MKITTLKGMKDLSFKEVEKYEYILKVAKEVFEKYGFEKIITPILEETELFKRSVGDETDVVSKEMYSFIDKGGRNISLRPEGTAGVVRSYLNNGLYKSNPIIKWYYSGPMYRYEAPQKGRYREFHQIGIECFGIRNPLIDAEIIKMGIEFLEKLGLKGLFVEINSLGNIESRKKYINDLQEYLLKNIENLSIDSKNRTLKNPLRVLDSKDEKDKLILKNAPNIITYYDDESLKYFKTLKKYLELFEVNFIENPNLVRGLDYYSDTVFEIKSDMLGAQSTILGGGRYDRLSEILADVKSYGIGFAAGIERIMLLLDENLVEKKQDSVYLVYFEETKEYMLEILKKLRENEIKVDYEYDVKSFSSQMKKANKNSSKYVLILGEEEKNENKVVIKNFINSTQEKLEIEKVIERIKNNV